MLNIEQGDLKAARKFIDSVLYPNIASRGLNWSSVCRRFKKYTVKDGSSCGRALVVEVAGLYFIINDGAHNSYMYFQLTFDEMSEAIQDITKQEIINDCTFLLNTDSYKLQHSMELNK